MCAKKATNTPNRKNTPVNRPVVQANKVEKAPVKAKESAPSPKKQAVKTPQVLPFERMNYILLGVGVGIIILGFLLMAMDNFVDATKFSISLYVAPIVVVAGFIEIIYAIMYTPKKKPQTPEV